MLIITVTDNSASNPFVFMTTTRIAMVMDIRTKKLSNIGVRKIPNGFLLSNKTPVIKMAGRITDKSIT